MSVARCEYGRQKTARGIPETHGREPRLILSHVPWNDVVQYDNDQEHRIVSENFDWWVR